MARAGAIGRYGDTTAVPGYLCAHGAGRPAAEAALRGYLAAAAYAVEPDPASWEWYRGLGRALDEAGLDPRASGYVAEERGG